jgi:AcrR family transcriptional regulator
MTDTRKPGRPKDPDLETRRKAEILSAAAPVFAAAGFANADVQDIADAVGVGKGTVYRYFPTKEALFLATVEKVVADSTSDPVDQVAKAVRAYLGFFAGRPDMAELFIQERAAFRQHHRPLYFSKDEEHEEKHREIFQRLVASGRLRDIAMERFFAVLGDLLYGTILTNLLAGRPADPGAQASDVLDILFHGVLKPGKGEK